MKTSRTLTWTAMIMAALCILSPAIAPAATIAWTNTSGGDWSVAGNWKPNQVPGDGDTALITSNGTYTVTLDVSATIASLTLGAASGQQTLANSGSTLTVTNASTVTTNGILGFSGGTLNGGGLLTVRGVLNWTGGLIDSLARVSIATNAALNVSGDEQKDLNGVLTNAGTVTWSGTGDWRVRNNPAFSFNGAIINLAGGLFNIQNDQTLLIEYGPEFFNNAGTFRKSAGSGTNIIYVIFNNTGTLDVQTGSLSLNNGGTGSGVFSGAGRTLIITSGYTFSPGSVITAATNLWTGGTISLASSQSLTNLQLAGATITGSGLLTVKTLEFTGGALNLTNIVTGTMNWTYGTIDSLARVSIATNATLDLSGAEQKTLYGVLTNAGTINWSGTGDWHVENNNGVNFSGAIINLAGGLFNIQNDEALTATYGFEFFNNAGTFRKSAGSGTNIIYVIFNNTGTVDVQTNVVSFNGSYALTGGTLNFGISSLTKFGQIILSGSAALEGTVSANLNNGYSPVRGNAFAVLSYGSETGIFTNVNLPSHWAWQTNYGATVFTLSILNTAPTLPGQTNRTMNELTTLVVTNTATDPDLPANTLTHTLLTAPGSATISTNTGVITWVTTEADGPGTNVFTTRVVDNGSPSLAATNTFTVIVNESNSPPVLTVPTNQTINELTFYTNNATATDADVPANARTFALVSGPTNLTVSPAGAITWTPSEAQGPSTNVVQIKVTDTNPPAVNATSLSVTSSFTLTVSEVNVAPLITVPGDQTIHAGVSLSLNTTATDADLPANTLTFALVSGPGALTVSGAGLIAWPTGDANAGTTNPVSVRVFDNGVPSLSSTGAFNVVVVSRPLLLTPAVSGTNVTLTWTAIPATSYRLQFNTNLSVTNWTSLAGDVTAVGSTASKLDPLTTSNRMYRVRVLP